MKIVIKKLVVTDLEDKKSKIVTFKPTKNLITSDKNSCGKSVLMKSIYHTLGADSSFDKRISDKDILFVVDFSCLEKEYRIVRKKESFLIFVNNQFTHFYSRGSRNEMANFYSSEFGVSVYLRSRDKTTELAPPAYLFIPYYLDQDRSWKEDQYPFSKKSMGQYDPISTNELYSYHLGLLSKDYGIQKSEIEFLKKQKKNWKKK